VVHRRAKLTPAGRQLLAERVIEGGWSVAAACDAAGVSRATGHKWVKRYLDEGVDGLLDRSSRPHHTPHALHADRVRKVLNARRRDKTGPHQLAAKLGLPRSTVYAVLRRHGVSRLTDLDRPTAKPIRYVRERPGELVHVDVKKFGSIPAGGGWRGNPSGHHTLQTRRNRAAANRKGRASYEFVHSMVDDCTRVAYSEILDDEKGVTCAGFVERAITWFATLGVRVEEVMTDEAKNYTLSRAFQQTLASAGARHYRTGPYRPQLNGKVERFHLTLKWEWAYKRLYKSNQARRLAYPKFINNYNQRRPHTALGGLSPMQFLNNVLGNHS
jgi:transposase InsO family protein